MSRAAPKARKVPTNDEVAEVGTPVKVNRADGDTLLGVVWEREEFPEIDAPARLVVEGSKTEVNVSERRVEVAQGTHADLVRSIVNNK